MLNAREAQELVKEYARKKEMERISRITKYLDKVGIKIHNASLCGIHQITVKDMENFSESVDAVANMETLGYEVSRHATGTGNYLTICWRKHMGQ